MLGIGMQQNQNDPNGIAWQQNRDFEKLLRRLNDGTEETGPFHKARGSSSPPPPSKEEEDEAKEGSGREAAHDKKERKRLKKSKSDMRRALPEDDDAPSPDVQAAVVSASK